MVDPDDSQKKEVKSIVYLLAILWILGVVAVVGLASIRAFSFANLLVLVVMPVVMFGLWTFKKWGMILCYVLCFIQGISFAIVSFNVVGLVIWGAILYYTYKNRNIFS